MTDTLEANKTAHDVGSDAATASEVQATDEQATEDCEPGLSGLLIRDVAAVLAGISLWAAADTWHQTSGLAIAQFVAVGDAILVGLLLAALFHEWGHYAGAKLSGASAPRVSRPGITLFRFNFLFAQNNHDQFHWMTYGAHIAHWSILLILVVALPLDSLSRISLVSSIFGFIVFATFIEYNIVKDTWAGADPETRLKRLGWKDFQQAGVAGSVAGLFAIAALS